MKERVKQEVKYYVELNNEKWGIFCGVVVGSIVGGYVEKNYLPEAAMADTFVKLVLQSSTVPATAGLFAALFSYVGKGVDIVLHDQTLLRWIVNKINYCRNSVLDSRDEQAFFMNGDRYRRRNEPEKGTLVLRHVDSEMTETLTPGSSNDSSPREAPSIMKTKGYQSGDMISVTIESNSGGSTSDAEEAITPVTSKDRNKKRCCC